MKRIMAYADPLKWYDQDAVRSWLEREKPELAPHAAFITQHLQAAFEKGDSIGRQRPAEELDDIAPISIDSKTRLSYSDRLQWVKDELARLKMLAATRQRIQPLSDSEQIERQLTAQRRVAKDALDSAVAIQERYEKAAAICDELLAACRSSLKHLLLEQDEGERFLAANVIDQLENAVKYWEQHR